MKYLGKTAPTQIAAADLETVPAPDTVRRIEIRGGELSAICPVTSQPDIYDITISYDPARTMLESKALKLYLNGWRDKGIMCEPLAAVIAADLASILGVGVLVTLTQQPRGGLSIRATAEGNPT